MFASFSGCDRLFSMQMNRSGNVDGIDFIVHQQVVPIRTPPARTELLRERLRKLSPVSTDSDQLTQRRIT
jgi:hypothetical protein